MPKCCRFYSCHSYLVVDTVTALDNPWLLDIVYVVKWEDRYMALNADNSRRCPALGRAKKSKAVARRAWMDGPQRNDETVARNLRHFRIARGLSQTELGNAVGVTFQQIQKYEEGTNAVAPGRLRQMCEILGVAPADMFGSQLIDGEPIPVMTPWAYRTLMALDKLRSERVRRSMGALIVELAGGQ
jgi:transcriptional regulator with XRE-family HTH domain